MNAKLSRCIIIKIYKHMYPDKYMCIFWLYMLRCFREIYRTLCKRDSIAESIYIIISCIVTLQLLTSEPCLCITHSFIQRLLRTFGPWQFNRYKIRCMGKVEWKDSDGRNNVVWKRGRGNGKIFEKKLPFLLKPGSSRAKRKGFSGRGKNSSKGKRYRNSGSHLWWLKNRGC